MASFLTTRGISSQLEDILIEANSFLYIITPYLQFSKTLYERLLESTKRGVPTAIVCREREKISPVDERLLMDLDCNIYYKNDLHAKCYMNEHGALIASMNLYNYSEANNREMGVFLSKLEDSAAYDKCFKEVRSIIGIAEPYKVIRPEEATNATETVNEYAAFLKGWQLELSKKYPHTKFDINENLLSASNFPFQDMMFSNEYGFASISFLKNNTLQNQRNEKKYLLETALREYRLYWHTSNRICLYQAKNVEFDNANEEYRYCLQGLTQLITELSTMMGNS